MTQADGAVTGFGMGIGYQVGLWAANLAATPHLTAFADFLGILTFILSTNRRHATFTPTIDFTIYGFGIALTLFGYLTGKNPF